MKILVACEESQIVCKAFRERGHEAYSCDIEPCSGGHPEWHLHGDVIPYLDDYWDMILAFPPCTYICSSGWFRSVNDPDRMNKSLIGIDFATRLFRSNVKKKVLENPVGKLSVVLGKPTQYVQPYQFGHDASKKTCLWIEGVDPLVPTKYIAPRIVTINGKSYERWSNQTDSGQNRLPPSEDRGKIRSKTYSGIAEAMASQWG